MNLLEYASHALLIPVFILFFDFNLKSFQLSEGIMGASQSRGPTTPKGVTG